MDQNGFLTGKATDTTWIKPFGQKWLEVTYSVVDGMAVLEGCLILGTVAQMQAVKHFIANNPLAIKAGIQPFAAGILGAQFRWKNEMIPFEIDQNLPNPQRVKDAIAHWQAKTPMKFVDRDPNNEAHIDYVVFRPGGGCASSVGRRGGRQDIILGPQCTAGNCIHEIGHTVGLWHEQSRSDRDDFVTINFAKVDPDFKHNFDMHIQDCVNLSPYDFGSIMHYPMNAFSTDGSDTIAPKPGVNTDGAVIGQRVALSASDIAGVNKLIAAPE